MSSQRVRPRLRPSRRLLLQLALAAGPAVGIATQVGRAVPTALARSVRPATFSSGGGAIVDMIGTDPEKGAPISRPLGFTPYVGATVLDGVQLALFLRAPGRILLVVEQFPPSADFSDPNAPPPTTLAGSVPLGPLPAGPSFIPWDYRVNGQGLGPGDYLIHAVLATESDQPTGMVAPVPYYIAIRSDASVQMQLVPATIALVNQDGSITLLKPNGSPQ